MQIITIDQIFQMFKITNDMTTMIFNALLNAIGENIINYSVMTWHNLLTGNLNGLVISVFILISTILFGYKTIRENMFKSIKYLFGIK